MGLRYKSVQICRQRYKSVQNFVFVPPSAKVQRYAGTKILGRFYPFFNLYRQFVPQLNA